MMAEMPNQPLEPMARSVTPSACAEVAPALAMAHHRTLGVAHRAANFLPAVGLRLERLSRGGGAERFSGCYPLRIREAVEAFVGCPRNSCYVVVGDYREEAICGQGSARRRREAVPFSAKAIWGVLV
jgi:hypothetical protein